MDTNKPAFDRGTALRLAECIAHNQDHAGRLDVFDENYRLLYCTAFHGSDVTILDIDQYRLPLEFPE